ncbi:MAG: ribosome biogenesis GTPase YlqF [Syntrophaceticus schinkii]
MTNLSKYLRVVDIIFEVADARCPFTSRSRQVKQLIKDKRSLLILNKADLADPHTTADWVEFYADRGEKALPVDALHGKGMAGVRKSLDQESQILHRLLKEKGRRNRPLRVAVMGIPNTGKSSFLNQLLGRRVVHRGDRPGITRGPQWVHLQGTISVLDTPGLLLSHQKDDESLFKLAVIRAADPERMDEVDLAEQLLSFLNAHYSDALSRHLCVKDTAPTLESVAREKNFLSSDGEYDLQRTAVFILGSYSRGMLGRISLEAPDNISSQ